MIKPNLHNDPQLLNLRMFNDRIAATNGSIRVGIDIPYVRWPDFLDPKTATLDLLNKCMMPAVDFMLSNINNPEWHCSTAFEQWEAAKLKRVFTSTLHYVSNPTNPKWPVQLRARLWLFANEHDKRRETDFNAAFPDPVMQQFFDQCRSDHEKLSAV
jgi:hypothetical protein